MTYFPRFAFPWMLTLLMLAPWAIYVGMRIRSLGPVRKWMAIGLRVFILVCLIGALAGAELVKKNDKLAVFFLLDTSNSVPRDVSLAAMQVIRNLAEQYMTKDDEAGVIVFGEEASIEYDVQNKLPREELRSYVGGEQTDLAGAIRLALAAFPEGYKKRIVILSDGNETRGAALEEAKLAQAGGVAVDVMPLEVGSPGEVRVREVSAPGRANASEPFQVRVVVQADQDCKATLRLFQRTSGGKRLLSAVDVTLQKGDNTFLLPQELSASGFYEYEATVESETDTVLANNEGQAYTIVYGEPRVLYIEGDPEHSARLGAALAQEGLAVERMGIGRLPTNLAQLQNYDAVILSNVSSTDFGPGQLKAIEAAVRDLGVGFIMVGGPESFGAGGYLNTPVEQALPVNMDIKQRKILPRGALALILHTCEIPDGNAWARDIGIAALEVLSSQDLMGTLLYGYGGAMGPGGAGWLFPLQPVGDKSTMRQALRLAEPGDMPDVASTLQMAYEALKPANAAVKRVVIISDGDPAAPTPQLLAALHSGQIAVSTVCIAPHSPSNEDMLKWVAQSTGGNYYLVTDYSKLPQIFTKEASVVKRGLLIEEPFTPQVLHDSELLAGIAATGLPQLNGYVATTPKDSATVPLVSHEKDPILAHWRYGLGKSVAFTSDATTRWAAPWLAWEGFNRFWVQTVRWSMRELQPSGFRIDTRVRDGHGHIRIDAVDDEGKFINFLRPRGVVTGPGPEFQRQELELSQTAPGIYEGAFPLHHRGVYMMNLTYERGDGTQGMIPAGLAMGYSREYEYNDTHLALLEHLARVGGGKVLTASTNPFDHNLEAAASITPLWLFLVMVAACVFPVEIFVRRVMVDVPALCGAAAMLLYKTPGLARIMPQPRPRGMPATGTYGASRPRAHAHGSSAGPTAPATSSDEWRRAGTDDPAYHAGLTEPEAEKRSPEATTHTQQLLEAKRRALEKQARRASHAKDPEKNKENP